MRIYGGFNFMKKYISILLAAVLVLACLSACGTSDKPADADNSEKLSVVTTIFPQYDFTRQIVGDKADVTMLLKPGAESHSYEPTPQDIKTIQNCDLFIYTGGENDVWVDDILNSMGDQRPDTLRLIDCVPTVNEEIVEADLLFYVVYSSSHSFSHEAALASLGIRQSPRGLSDTDPTLGPSGRQERLNCC